MNRQPPSFIALGREVCGELAQAERREWWLANGLGAYAAGTVAGSLTRRYHGLLIAPVDGSLARCLVFAKADATVIDGQRRYPLYTNRWGVGVVDPPGYVHIESFRLEGRMPVWRFAVNEARIEQCIWMERGAHTTYVAFRLVPGALADKRDLRMKITLLVNARDHHGGTRVAQFVPVVDDRGDALRVSHAGGFTLQLNACGGTIAPRREWYENFDLPVERERGLPDRDNHLCVGEATLDLNIGEWAGIAASLGSERSIDVADAMRRFQANDLALLKRAKASVPELAHAPAWVDQLVLAADDFIIARPLESLADGESVIAGYPWFGEWGRDTFAALPGLTLAVGRFDTCLRVLRTYAPLLDKGMLPNRLPERGEAPEYNTADAALWYIEAWRAYFAASGDREALKEIFPRLADIVDQHVQGTRYSIRVDPEDGLLYAGEPGIQLTWMDAKVGDRVVTPRIGKPVELNALWYNALAAMAGLARQLALPVARYRSAAAKAKRGFERFMNAADGGLFDVLDSPDGNDATLRPNQIFAVSLPFSPLDAAAQASVAERVARTLLVSHGLRSLGPGHPDYRPRYSGSVWERDSAYHQGTAWAWLLGHYALAAYRVHGDAEAAQARLAPFREHLFDAGLGTISEIFDGDPPGVARGCPAQAWSVACTLDAWVQLERAKRAAVSRRRRRGGERVERATVR